MSRDHSPANDFIFFGSSRMSATVLDELARHGMKPKAIVTTPDRPKGRKLVLTPPEPKIFGEQHGIPVLQFEKLDADAIAKLRDAMDSGANGGAIQYSVEYFIVASYGLIIPQAVLDLPPFGTLNIHPSLLPEYRGATPLQQAILDDRSDTGVTIMLIDAKMDHGPIILKEKRNAGEPWPKRYADFEDEMARQGARMIADNIDRILGHSHNGKAAEKIQPQEQNHEQATFTKKISKTDGEIDISEDAMRGTAGRKQFLKFNAYHEWPTTFFFAKMKTTDGDAAPMRIKITEAVWDDAANDGAGEMKITKVIPEGQKETLWSEFRKKLA